MPDKQLVITIPEPNKDGTCNDQCPLKIYDDNEGTICRHELYIVDDNGRICPGRACPQWKE